MSVDAGHGGAAAAAVEPVRASVSGGQHAPAPSAAAAAAHDVKADASSGGGAIHAAVERVHVAVDNSAAINANCTAAYLGRADALREAKEGLFEVGVVVLEGAPHALFHVPDGSKASADASGKPYRLLPLHAIVEQPAPPKAEVNPDDSYYDEPRGGESPKRLPQYFAFWRAPVFYAAAAGRKDAIAALIERHRDCAADRARIYTAKPSANQPGKWEVQENAAEHATTPKPKFVDAAAVARANGFDDAALALDKSYRACSTEDCSLM